MEPRQLFLASLLLGLCACAKSPTASRPAPVLSKSPSVISQSLIDSYLEQKIGVPTAAVDAALKARLLKELQQLAAAAQEEADRADASTEAAIELQRIELLAHAGAIAAGVFAPPSDADLKAEYDHYVANLPPKEYHVAHILVPTQAAAQVIITKLQGGADFATLAREQSADDSKVRGGDLGWIAPGRLPVDFTNAVDALKVSHITTTPVHTVYGWHVMKLLESRPTTPTPFEQVKAQLGANLQQIRYQQFLESALANAQVHTGG
jgi:peptidyl-prolyl cis-trans isomerase C